MLGMPSDLPKYPYVWNVRLAPARDTLMLGMPCHLPNYFLRMICRAHLRMDASMLGMPSCLFIYHAFLDIHNLRGMMVPPAGPFYSDTTM